MVIVCRTHNPLSIYEPTNDRTNRKHGGRSRWRWSLVQALIQITIDILPKKDLERTLEIDPTQEGGADVVTEELLDLSRVLPDRFEWNAKVLVLFLYAIKDG